ncbi:hypothetical protein HDR61_03290 [bacterium]|nr:hypothetical protein [bacterium]
MEYPSDFDTPAFPAGKQIAVSRAFGIGILGVFLLVVFMCVMVAWARRSMQLEPYLITTGNPGGAWHVIGRSTSRNIQYPIWHTMQEAVAINFTQGWFYISNSPTRNEDVWRKCPADRCTGAEILNHNRYECAISCMSETALYKQFTDDVAPIYRRRQAEGGETWGVMQDTLQITKIGKVSADGGMWRVNASVWSNVNSVFNIIAFVRIGRKPGEYPMTMGYYVTEFNAYRIK